MSNYCILYHKFSKGVIILKYLILLYLIVLAGMIVMIPIKLFSSRQIRCPHCQGSVLIARRKKDTFTCPHCGKLIQS